MTCPEHPHGSPLCLQSDLPTFTGRVELRDGPDWGHVSGEWTPAHDLRQLIGDVLALIGVGIVVAAFVWALLVLLLVLS